MKLELQSATARHPLARPQAPAALLAASLRVASGEQLAIIGPSGAGKTTLLQVMACAMRPQLGQVLLNGTSPWALPRSALQQLRGQLFLAPQVPPLPPRQRVVTAVLAGRLPGMSLLGSVRSLFYPSDIPAAHDALERFDLADKLFERVDRLSGGERQRVGLARAFVSPARLWLIDEPLSALDPSRAQQALDALTTVAHDQAITLVATLHQVDMALAHFPRIVGLREGAVVFDLPRSQVTPTLLAQLYAQHEDELHGGAAPVPVTPETSAPAVMHCR